MKIQVLNIIRKYRVTLVFSLILTVLFFGTNSSIEFATDSYEVLNTEGSWKWMLYDNGRLVNALVYYVIERMGLSHGIIYHLSFFSAMLFLYFAVCLWSYILRRYIENEYVCVMLSFLGIVNPYFVEYFLFIEKGLFLFAV
ncbi:MAG: hypothetical protein IJC59_05495, partial [Lachnospiraceae bacterium]|nr:hypothetical protein [Lachnospiraceae bacterium]